MDQLAAIRVYVRVAESGSFSEAARRLDLSKSAVSKHVAALEDHLGTRLLYRTTRRVSLTEAGQAYLDRALRILDDLEEADNAVASLTAEPRGRLKVNAPLSFGLLHLSSAIADFCSAFPQIVLNMEFNDRFVDLVDEGFDVAVRIGNLADSSLIARRIAPARMIFCASPGYLEQAGTPTVPADIADHACLRYWSPGGNPDEWTAGGPDGPVAVKISGPLVANNGEVLRDAAIAGLGITRMPTFIVSKAIADGRLVEILADYRPEPLTIQAVYPPNRHLSVKVRRFIDFLVERFGPEPYWDR